MPLIQKSQIVQPLAPSTNAPLLPKAPAVQTTAKPALEGRGFVLQPWVTIRGNASSPNAVKSVTQDDALWMNLERFADAGFWVDVSGVTLPSGGKVYLNLESSPTLDEADFRPVAPPVELAAKGDAGGAVTPLFTKTIRTPTTVPLTRFTRWRVSTDGTSGVWDASFRIRGIGGSNRFWVPTDIAGCKLWLRADLGITLVSGVVSVWDDQSGVGNNASQSASDRRPGYNTVKINGYPTVQFDASGGGSTQDVLTLPSFSTLTAGHVFLINKRVAATPPTSARAGFWRFSSNANASHVPFTDGVIYDGAGSTTRNSFSPSAGIDLAAPHCYEIRTASNEWTCRINGVQQYTTASNTVGFATSTSELGGDPGWNTYYDGSMAEILIYDRILPTNARLAVIRYFNERYGLTIA